jgi:hypothetical protein
MIYYGVVEEILDPKQLGRIQVRVMNVHPINKSDVKTDDLVWSMVVGPTTSPGVSGLGHSPYLVKGSTVVGIFTDKEFQDFLVLGSLPTQVSANTIRDASFGFTDPDGEFPRKLNEPDLNIRSRGGEDPDKEFDTQRGQYQPYSTYNPVYPNNHVYETTSGHLKEFDDTVGAERIREKHKSGTYYEIQSNGTKVERIERDNYQLVIGENTIEVFGSVNIICSQNVNLSVGGNIDAYAEGDILVKSEMNANIEIENRLNVDVGDDIKIDTKESAHITAQKDINIVAGKALQIISEDDMLIESKKNIQLKGENIFINE